MIGQSGLGRKIGLTRIAGLMNPIRATFPSDPTQDRHERPVLALGLGLVV